MRPIDADALKAEIQRRRKRYKTLTGVDMAMLIDDAPTIDGWISVKDRLPEVKMSSVNGEIAFSDYVLIYKVYEDGTPWMAIDTCRVDKATWMTAIPGGGWTVTHWMPLPEPPEVEA